MFKQRQVIHKQTCDWRRARHFLPRRRGKRVGAAQRAPGAGRYRRGPVAWHLSLSPVTCLCHLKNPINNSRAGLIFDAPARQNAAPRKSHGWTQVATQVAAQHQHSIQSFKCQKTITRHHLYHSSAASFI